jgi:tetratricopeptide (TPR) repeat protein
MLKAKYADRPETALVEATYNAMKEKDLVKRIAVLKSAMEEHPDIAELHKSLGDAYMQAAMLGEEGVDPVDRYHSAILEFNKVLDVSRGRADIYHRLAVVHTTLGGALTRAGRMRKAAEEYAKSREILTKLLEIAPKKALYLRLLAEAEGAGGNSEKAVRLYEQSAKIREEQVEQAENKPEEDSARDAYKRELGLIYKRLIRLYSDMERNDKAAEMTQKAKALELATTAREILTLDVTEAVIAERNGDYDKARKILETAFDKEEICKDKQQHMQLIRQMSLFYQRRRNAAATDEERKEYREKREQILNEGIELYPDSTQMYIWKAEMYISEGQSERARELVDLAVEKATAVGDEDKDIMVYASASSFYERQARTQRELRKAEDLLLEAVRLASDRPSEEPLYREHLLGFYFRHMGVFEDKARNYVAELLGDEPENPRYLVFSGRLMALTGDPGGAEKQFEKATKVDSAPDTAYVQWADAIFEESPDRIDEAIEVVECGLEENDGSIALRNALGRFYMIKKEYDKARECFRKVLAVNGRDFTALDAVARLSLEALAAPRVDYKNALKDAEAAVNALYRYYPDAPATYRVLGFLELQQGYPEKAVGHFKQAYALGNDPVSLRILSHLCLGRQAVSFDPENLATWAKTLPRWQYNTAIKMLIGRCLLKARRDGAESFFRDVAESADNPAEPYLFTDIHYLNRHRTSTAKRYFNKCLERMDKSVAGTTDFAKLYVEAGHPRRAIELIERVSENIGEKDRPELDAMRAYIYLFELDDAEEAEKIILPVVESDLKPKPAVALCVIGKIMCDRGGEEFEQGLEYIKSAVRAEPSAPSYYCALAEAYYKSYMKNGRKVDMRAALAAIENTMRMDPNYYMLPSLHLWCGDMYYKDGDKEKARENYGKYLGLGGKERAEEVGKRLEE